MMNDFTSAGAVLTGHVDRLALFRTLLTDVETVHDLPAPAILGSYGATKLVVIGTGMGGPVTARAAAALLDRGCRTLVRAGGAGPVQPSVQPGDVLIATAAVRHEGASRAFLPPTFPAVADPYVVDALLSAAIRRGVNAKAGVLHSKDSFYGEIDPDSSPNAPRLHQLWNAWVGLGVLGSEMEAATLFAVATARGARAGAVLRVNDVTQDSGSATQSQLKLCEIAVQATAAIVDRFAKEDARV